MMQTKGADYQATKNKVKTEQFFVMLTAQQSVFILLLHWGVISPSLKYASTTTIAVQNDNVSCFERCKHHVQT
jgi:hypothetical protein